MTYNVTNKDTRAKWPETYGPEDLCRQIPQIARFSLPAQRALCSEICSQHNQDLGAPPALRIEPMDKWERITRLFFAILLFKPLSYFFDYAALIFDQAWLGVNVSTTNSTDQDEHGRLVNVAMMAWLTANGSTPSSAEQTERARDATMALF